MSTTLASRRNAGAASRSTTSTADAVRLTMRSRSTAFLAVPTSKFEKINRELVGFHFCHALEASPVALHGRVRAIKFDAPEHANPLVLPRTRDELVGIVPDVFPGRALPREKNRWNVVGDFGLRNPVGG